MNKKNCSIVSFLAGNLSMWLLYELRMVKKKMNINTVGHKDKKYLKLFDNWLILIERGDCIERFLKEKNIKSIAIYGYGNIGRHLMIQLSDSDIQIKYVIDKNRDGILTNDIPCYLPTQDMPGVDAIVVTPICEYLEIKNSLEKFTQASIISIEDIIYELL